MCTRTKYLTMSIDFRSTVEKSFAPVTAAHALRLLREDSDRFGSEVVIGNMTTALRFRLEPREGLFVSLLRLHDSGIPSRDLDDRMRDPINGFDVDDLIQLRAPQCAVSSKAPLDDEALQAALRGYAFFLSENGQDVLSGDFSVFSDLARCVAMRIRHSRREGYSLGPDSLRFLEAADLLEGSD